MDVCVVKIEQYFSENSLSILKMLIGKDYFTFLLKRVCARLAIPDNDKLIGFSITNGSDLKAIAAVNSKNSETLATNILIPPFFEPRYGILKKIEMDYKTNIQTFGLGVNFSNLSNVVVWGKLLSIDIYHYREEHKSYDVQTLENHELRHLHENPPSRFEYLLTVYDYFVYLVFHFEGNDLLIIERPKSSDVINFHYDNATEVLKHIKESINGDSNELQYYLVHTIV